MKGYTAEQIQAAEAPLLAAGVPLMQRAAAALAREVQGLLDERGIPPETAHVLILAGAGNNGGDALYAARRLADAGAIVEVLPTSSHIHEEGLASVEEAGAELISPVGAPEAQVVAAASAAAARSDVIVDGILGTGSHHGAQAALRGPARAAIAAIIQILNEGRVRPAVVAVDIPSGIDPDSGEVPDPAVLPADLTVTFGAAKAGLLLDPARTYAGDLSVIDVGLIPELAGVTPAVVV